MLLYKRVTCSSALILVQYLGIVVLDKHSQTASAQLPQVADSRLGVDLVQLVDGSRLYGFVLERAADSSLKVAVEREWLKGQYPKLHADFEARELAEAKAAHEQLITRLDAWLEERSEPGPLQRFLTVTLAETRERKVETDPTKLFFAVTLAPSEFRKVTIQAPDRRHVAGIAYQNRLPEIITTPSNTLAKRLVEMDVQPAAERVDLSGELPEVARQTDRQWAARKALIEYTMREPLEYQGTGNTLVRTGAQADPMALIGKMLGGSGGDAISRLGAELGLPEFTKPKETADWWRKTTQAAERDGFHGVLITRLEQNMLAADVKVEASFFARLAPGEWFRVATFNSQSSVNEQNPGHMDQLKQDPQIQSVIRTLESLGLAASEQLDQALRHGAATQVALADAHAAWNMFQQQHTRSMSGSPVPIEGNSGPE